MQLVGVEAILGLRIRGDGLHIDPCIPPDWPGFTATIRWKSSRYAVTVDNQAGVGRGVQSITLNGVGLEGAAFIGMVDDGGMHTVGVTLGRTATERAA
jgi:cyclic beta-1,2-glucan synthetase